MMYDMIWYVMLWYDIFNCHWFATRWQ